MKPALFCDVTHAIAIHDKFSPQAKAKIVHCGVEMLIIWDNKGCFDALSEDDHAEMMIGLKDWP